MKGLAAFVMRGMGPATMVATVFAVLGLLITPLGIISAAAVALVSLRQGVKPALLVMALSLVAVSAFGFMLFQQPISMFLMGLGLWLPPLILAEVLRVTRSLRISIELGVVVAVALIGLQYLLLDDVNAFWSGYLGDLFRQILDPAAVTDAEVADMVTLAAPWMAGALAAAWFLQLTLVLFLARSWQAALYNPGGFREEFHQLRLGRWLLILLPVAMGLGMLDEEPNLSTHLSLVGVMAFFLQGTALVHGLVGLFKASSFWLIGFYFMLVIGMPSSLTAVSAAGYVDGWLNFRAKARTRTGNDQGE